MLSECSVMMGVTCHKLHDRLYVEATLDLYVCIQGQCLNNVAQYILIVVTGLGDIPLSVIYMVALSYSVLPLSLGQSSE